MGNVKEIVSFNQEPVSPPPAMTGEYSSVRVTNEEKPSHFTTKFGAISLRTFEVEVAKSYDDAAPRTTRYESLVAYRTDDDAPDQTRYPLVQYSNALLTTPRKKNTATNRYFLNPAYEGFAAVNVSAKLRPFKSCMDRLAHLVPHTISLEEMSDDEIVIAAHLAQEIGLGKQPDKDGERHINKSGYSRGVQISIMQAARAGLHGMAVDRLHGRGPGPINKSSLPAAVKTVWGKLGKEGTVALGQVIHDPLHAANNYLNTITHRGGEIASYVGDADALLQGDVGHAMRHINPAMRGYVKLFTNDPFGQPGQYVIHFHDDTPEEVKIHRSRFAPDFRLIHQDGAHMSGFDKSEVKYDRQEWAAERAYLDSIPHTPTSFAS